MASKSSNYMTEESGNTIVLSEGDTPGTDAGQQDQQTEPEVTIPAPVFGNISFKVRCKLSDSSGPKVFTLTQDTLEIGESNDDGTYNITVSSASYVAQYNVYKKSTNYVANEDKRTVLITYDDKNSLWKLKGTVNANGFDTYLDFIVTLVEDPKEEEEPPVEDKELTEYEKLDTVEAKRATYDLSESVTETVNGKEVPDFAKNNTYKILKVLDDRAIIRAGLTYTLAVKAEDITVQAPVEE